MLRINKFLFRPDAIKPRAFAFAFTSQKDRDQLVDQSLNGSRRLESLGCSSPPRQSNLGVDTQLPQTGVAFGFGGLKRADDDGDTKAGGAFGVSVTLPLFNRGDRDVARWNAERSQIQFERTILDSAIRAEITTAAAILILRRQVTTMARNAQASADELVTIADVAYREGEAGILQLLDAYRTRGRAQDRAAAAALELRLGEIALERAAGVTLWP